MIIRKLCIDKHLRWFVKFKRYAFISCIHCKEAFYFYKRTHFLKSHICNARLNELKEKDML